MSGRKGQRRRRTKTGPWKLGRNDPCSCGSGLKFKKCCLPKVEPAQPKISASKDGMVWKEPPLELREKAMRVFEEKQRKERDRVARYGHIRPQMSVVHQGQRMVTVRNRIYYSDKWKFFPDFLRDYVPQILGLDWCKAEAAKPEAERHPIITWRAQAQAYMNGQPAQPDGSRVALPSGAVAAYTCFAYDLYVVDDNGGLDDEFLQRLKNRELFQGARHELFAEATCYRAGFTVEHENEKDGSTRHAEFTVRHAATGQLLSVEAKSRHRAGVLAMPGIPEEKPNFRLLHLINEAVAKNPKHPLVIFVDTNLPFKWAERLLGRLAGNTISRPIQTLLDRLKNEHNDVDPYCMIIFSNHPHHYAVHDLDPQQHLLSVLSQQPKAHMLSLRSLFMAASLYGNIPMGFSLEEGDPPPPAVPVVSPKVRYDLQVTGTDVDVVREGNALGQKFSITEKDRPQAPSKLHEFLEDIGLSRVDAHMICSVIEEGKSLSGVFAPK
jgi:SEC-C motif-containing protein